MGDHAPINEFYLRSGSGAGFEGWTGEGASFCVFSGPQPGTVPLQRYCIAENGGRIYRADGGGAPGNGLGMTWGHCGQIGFIYPP